jgi:hypothetical protein
MLYAKPVQSGVFPVQVLLILKKYSENEMKVNILKPTVTILFTVSALLVLVLGKVSAQKTASLNPVTASSLGIAVPAQTPSAASQEKTVEQTRKNIKVLTGRRPRAESERSPGVNWSTSKPETVCLL